MATIHQATLSPGKLDLLAPWIAAQRWAPSGAAAGAPTLLGAYRFDDRDGEVGIEGHLLDLAGVTVHVVTTYRAAPLPDAERFLIGTTEHSALGRRWVYDAAGDPVALRELATAALTGATQAEQVVVDADGNVVERREASVHVLGSGQADPAEEIPYGHQVEIVHVLDGSADTHGGQVEATLNARWGVFDDAVVIVVVRRR